MLSFDNQESPESINEQSSYIDELESQLLGIQSLVTSFREEDVDAAAEGAARQLVDTLETRIEHLLTELKDQRQINSEFMSSYLVKMDELALREADISQKEAALAAQSIDTTSTQTDMTSLFTTADVECQIKPAVIETGIQCESLILCDVGVQLEATDSSEACTQTKNSILCDTSVQLDIPECIETYTQCETAILEDVSTQSEGPVYSEFSSQASPTLSEASVQSESPENAEFAIQTADPSSVLSQSDTFCTVIPHEYFLLQLKVTSNIGELSIDTVPPKQAIDVSTQVEYDCLPESTQTMPDYHTAAFLDADIEPGAEDGPSNVAEMETQTSVAEIPAPVESEYIESLEEELLEMQAALAAHESAAQSASTNILQELEARIERLLIELGAQREINKALISEFVEKQEMLLAWEGRLLDATAAAEEERQATTTVITPTPNSDLEALTAKLSKAKDKLRRVGVTTDRGRDLLDKIKVLSR